MPVGLLTLELHIPDAQSLKDKRQVLRSLKDKLRRFQTKRSTSRKFCKKFWMRPTVFWARS